MPELLRSIKISAEVETSATTYEHAFILHEEESVDNFLLRVRQWIEEHAEGE